MKSITDISRIACNVSRPARGGWIEIDHDGKHGARRPSRPARGGWIEIALPSPRDRGLPSRPARGGWIEIKLLGGAERESWVPPRKGRVD